MGRANEFSHFFFQMFALLNNWSIFSLRFAFWTENFLVWTNFEMLQLSILDSINDLWPEPCIFPPAESERAKTFQAKTFRIEHVNKAIVKFEKKCILQEF